MKKSLHTVFLTFITLLPTALLFSSCYKEAGPFRDGTTTVSLNIGVQGADLSLWTKADPDPNVKPYEGIRTLRVIIISQEDASGTRNILHNQKYVIDNSNNPQTAVLSHSLQLNNVPIGPANIYVIVNEESIIDGDGYTDEILKGEQYKDDNKLLVLDDEWNFFPKKYEDIAEHGLPMSGRKEGINIDENSSFTIDLVRAVVKLQLTVANDTKSDLTIEKVSFGSFFSNRVYMFRTDGQSLDIPEGTVHREQSYDMNYSLSKDGGETQWNPIYIFPNHPPASQVSPYKLSLETNLMTYPASNIDDELSYMIRNTQINIKARITASATIEIDYEHVPWTNIPWENGEIIVPPFE